MPSSETPKIQTAAAERRVIKLMGIPGPSCQEGRAARWIIQQLKRAGLDDAWLTADQAHTRTPEPGETGNLILKLPGTRRGPRRLLSAHLDTVPVCVGSQPRQHGRLVRSDDPKTGLGADNRAGCAVLLTAALEVLRQELPHPPLTFCWFVQEEIGLQGARLVDRRLLGRPRLAFNWDGGSPTKLTIGATGGYRMKIAVEGIASHAGGAPEWGVNAITVASLAIAQLEQDGWLGQIVQGKQHGTANIGVIAGGAATNVVTERVELKAEARSHDPRFRLRIVREIENAFRRASDAVANVAGAKGNVQFEGGLDYESFRLKTSTPCVQAATRAIERIGEAAEYTIANGGLDANWLTRHGIDTVSLGCGQANQHMVSETLDLDRYLTACRLALILATGQESYPRIDA